MISVFISLALAIIGALSIYTGDIQLLKITVFSLWLNNVLYAIQSIKKNIVFLLFNFTFFTFLLGKPFAAMLASSDELKDDIILSFSPEIQLHLYACLFISLVSLFWAYIFFSRKNNDTIYASYYNETLINAYRNAAKKMSYFFFIFALIVNLEKAIFVLSVGYIEYYTEYSSALPSIFTRLANFYTLSLFFYLVTMPTKKDAKWPILLFLFLGITSLGYGQRNGLMMSLTMIVLYYFIRQKLQAYGPNEVWVTKRKIIYSLVALPFLLIFLMSFNDIRNNQEVSLSSSFWNNFLSFFYQQGISVSIIGYEKELHNHFPQDFPYSLGYFVDRITNIEFLKPLHIFPTYAPKSYELAVYGHNFGETITYLQNPNRYFAGGGLGSCYIAEIYHDFGYLGVVIINMFFAFIFARFDRYFGRNIWMSFCIFILLDRVLYSPRADALGCFTEFLSSVFIVFVLVMSFIKHRHSR